MFDLQKNLTLESFQLYLLVVLFSRNNLFLKNEHFSQKVQSSLEVQRTKKNFSDNPGHNIKCPGWNFTII